MARLAIMLLAVFLYGCSTSTSRIDEYRYVAYSWTDGNIADMIATWGTPQAGHKEATDSYPGFARWRAFSRTGGGGNGEGHVRYHCDTIARFGADGRITEIEIRRSQSCDRHYKDLDSMLRPGVKPPPSSAENSP